MSSAPDPAPRPLLARVMPVVPWIALALGLLALGYRSATFSLSVPLNHIDGAFQTASALDRLNQGQFPGRDFFPYLGLASVYLLFPVFKLAGSTLCASGFAATFSCFLMQAVVFAIIIRLMRRETSSLHALVVSLVLLLLAMACVDRFKGMPELIGRMLHQVVNPGNSLKPVRTAAPFLVAACVWWVVRRYPPSPRRYALMGMIGGVVLGWSNDFGIPSAGLLSLLALGDAIKQGVPVVRNALVFTAAFVMTGVVVLTVATAFHPWAFISYNFVDVARDQWWFFAPWGPASRVFAAADLLRVFNWLTSVGFIVLVVVGVFAWVRPAWERVLLLYIGAAELAGGLVATIGGHWMDIYFAGFVWWGILIVLIALALLVGRALHRIRFIPALGRNSLLAVMAAAAMLYSRESLAHFEESSLLAADESLMYVPELGGYISRTWTPYVEHALSPQNELTVEEYWGIWGALTHAHPARVDSVIHALGRERQKFAQLVAGEARQVISSREEVSGEWHAWNFSADWWLYATLLREFKPLGESPTTIVWERQPPKDWPKVACRVSGSGTIHIDSKGAGYYEVSVDYEVPNPSRSLFEVENNLNVAGGIPGWLSIDPRASTSTFPVRVRQVTPGHTVAFRRVPEWEKGPGFTLKSCEAREVVIAPEQQIVLPRFPEEKLRK